MKISRPLALAGGLAITTLCHLVPLPVQAANALSGLTGSLPLGSLSSSSAGNAAGILEFCVKNNYLSGDSVSSMKNALLKKVPGGSSGSDSDYSDGAKGILHSPGGQTLNLSGSNLKDKATKQVCEMILSQSKSLL
ncbi:DUF2501 domain-containing protein [Pseudomonas panipatensis]|uniref:DUF2501 domain-containing protein n=1 Tax=Pseudomonas panipatensis TaxID=428992 RepID=A0A1G8KT34_9PSED|nr:DUF2501 domain-containing protein [Pseudomonas panipatensis]SDI46522.1 Protein of unknown function [Pseudomonas panipatensis]SMP70561.1 Protein of unknown function [Pseudomonas panipatensis]